MYRKTQECHIKTDSKWVVNSLCENLESSTSLDFVNVAHANLLRPIISALRKRAGCTTFEWIKGHTGIVGNEGADKLAAMGAQSANPRNTLLISQPEYHNNGAKMSKLHQATAYSLILRSHPDPKPPNKASTSNLNLIREATHDLDGTRPTNDRIWLAAIKNRRDISTNVRTFLWKLIHNAHKCGQYWLKIRNFEERGMSHSSHTP